MPSGVLPAHSILRLSAEAWHPTPLCGIRSGNGGRRGAWRFCWRFADTSQACGGCLRALHGILPAPVRMGRSRRLRYMVRSSPYTTPRRCHACRRARMRLEQTVRHAATPGQNRAPHAATCGKSRETSRRYYIIMYMCLRGMRTPIRLRWGAGRCGFRVGPVSCRIPEHRDNLR